MRRVVVAGLHVLETVVLNLFVLLGEADVAVDVKLGLKKAKK
jgi:hypothetical protein